MKIGTYYPYIIIIFATAIFSLTIYFLLTIIRPQFIEDIFYGENLVIYSELENDSLFGNNSVLSEFTNSRKYLYSPINKDFRAVVLDSYLKRDNSPLTGLGDKIVEACDKYNAPEDCTTLVAIARIETDLCNYGPSQQQKNCWGFGGAGENRIYFESYNQAIDFVTDRLANSYGYYYMVYPNEMEMTYCGPRESCRTWGDKVEAEMNRINNYSINLGFPDLFNLRSRNIVR